MKDSAIIQGELIGLSAKVVTANNASYVSMSGTVVNETRNTLVIRNTNTDKVIIKETSVFKFIMPDGTAVEIDGKAILGRPEDRVKKRLKRRW